MPRPPLTKRSSSPALLNVCKQSSAVDASWVDPLSKEVTEHMGRIDVKLERGFDRVTQALEDLVLLLNNRASGATALASIDRKLTDLQQQHLPKPSIVKKRTSALANVLETDQPGQAVGSAGCDTPRSADKASLMESSPSAPCSERFSDQSRVYRTGSQDLSDTSIANVKVLQRRHCGVSSDAKNNKMEEIRRLVLVHEHTRGKYTASIWRFLENPYSSAWAQVYSGFIPCCVLSSVFLSFWQTVDGCPLRGVTGEIIQTCFEAVFAVELVTRFLVCPDRCDFWHNPFNYIDMLTVLPVLFRVVVGFMALSGSDSMNAEDLLAKFSLLPALRLLKLTRRFEKFQLLLSAFLIAFEALPVLLYTLVIIAIFFSALIFFVEPSDNIENLPRALWFIIVTMTTVGYGDVTPDTAWGHVIMTVLMIISGLYMAIPIGIVGNAFSTVWSARDRLLLMHRLREAFLQEGFSERALHNIVNLFDVDNNGEVGFDEFQTMLEAMHIHIGDDRVYDLLDSFDQDKSGKISVDELLNGLFPKDYAEFFNHVASVRTTPSAVAVTSGNLDKGNSASTHSLDRVVLEQASR